jgi:hypothetical protein
MELAVAYFVARSPYSVLKCLVEAHKNIIQVIRTDNRTFPQEEGLPTCW